MSGQPVRAVSSATGTPSSGPRRRSWFRALLVVVPVVALLWLLASALAPSGPAASPASSGQAPPFVVHDLATGATISSADLRGRVAVLNFWASWCEPCRQEAPVLHAAWERTRGDGVAFVGITYQDDPNASRAFARAHGVAWPIALDTGGTVAHAFGVAGVPETIVLSASGAVVAHAVGPVTEADLLGWIRDAARGVTG